MVSNEIDAIFYLTKKIITRFKTIVVMKIDFNCNQTFLRPNFRAIELKKEHEAKVCVLFQQYMEEFSSAKCEVIKKQIYNVLNDYLVKDAASKTRPWYSWHDYLQEIYLSFFRALEKYKNICKDGAEYLYKVIEEVSGTKPKKTDLRVGSGLVYSSMDVPVHADNTRRMRIENLTEKDLTTPLSRRNEEEREAFMKNVKQLERSANLTKQERGIVEKRARGATYKKIGADNGYSRELSSIKCRSAVAKIQKSNGSLPKEYRIRAKEFIHTFRPNMSEDEVVDWIIKYPNLLRCDINKCQSNVYNAASVLRVELPKYIEAVFKFPKLMLCHPDALKQNVEDASSNFGIKKHKYIEIVLKNPALFYYDATTLNKNVEKMAKVLKISKADCIKLSMKTPVMLCQSPETVDARIESVTKILGINREQYLKIATKQPQILVLKPETLKSNYNLIKKFLCVSDERLNKMWGRMPALMCMNPNTVNDNIEKMVSLTHIPREDIVKAYISTPSNLCQKPTTLYSNIRALSKNIGVPEDVAIKMALRQPSLFCQNPDTIAGNFKSSAECLGISKEEFVQIVTKEPILLAISPVSLKRKKQLHEYYNKTLGEGENRVAIDFRSDDELFSKIIISLINHQKQNTVSCAIRSYKTRLEDYLSKNSKEMIELNIPKGELAEDLKKFAKELSKKTVGKSMFRLCIK